MLRASPLRGIAPSRYGVGSSACPALFLRPHAHHRPHVSISWALPQTLASCGILPNTPCGWHLLTTTRESTCRVTPFPVPMVASVGRCSPPGFCGSANRSVPKAAGALSCAVLAPACQPLALVGLHDGSLHPDGPPVGLWSVCGPPTSIVRSSLDIGSIATHTPYG